MSKRIFPDTDGRKNAVPGNKLPGLPTLRKLFCRKREPRPLEDAAIQVAENEGMPVLTDTPG